jgi:AraC-like DNA-binding protein
MSDAVAVSLVYRSEEEPARSRLDRLLDLTADSLAPLEVRIAEADFRSRVVTGKFGVSQIFELTIDSPATARRTPKLIRRSDPEFYKLDVVVHGQLVVGQGGRESRLGPGDLSIFDLSRPAYWVNQPARFVGVGFPRTLLPLRPDEVSRLTGLRIDGGRGAGALVSQLARQMPRHLDEYGAADGTRLGTAVLDLITAVLAARLDRESAVPPGSRQHALLLRIHAFIELRLSDPRLTPATIAAAHHISPRYLHKLFQTQPATVSSWIRQRRLDRCRRDLLDPALRSRPVSAIGARWGFTSPAQFNRAFTAAYGMPPGEYRLRSTAPEDRPAG